MESTTAKKYQCNICEKSFAEEKTLKGHKDHIHFGKSFECEICQKKFPSKKNVQVHKKTMHEKRQPKEELYSCDFCF